MLSANACQWRRNCWPHVGLKGWEIHELRTKGERMKGILTSSLAPLSALEHTAPAWVPSRLCWARRPNTLLDDLLERAAGIGQRLLICRIAGAATLTRRGTTEASLVFEFFSITIIVFTATLPRRAARERSDYRKVAIVGVVEIAVCVGIYRVWGGGCRGG